jgi:hypothetical protein
MSGLSKILANDEYIFALIEETFLILMLEKFFICSHLQD